MTTKEIRLSRQMLSQLDEYATKNQTTRSAVMRDIVEDLLSRPPEPPRENSADLDARVRVFGVTSKGWTKLMKRGRTQNTNAAVLIREGLAEKLSH